MYPGEVKMCELAFDLKMCDSETMHASVTINFVRKYAAI